MCYIFFIFAFHSLCWCCCCTHWFPHCSCICCTKSEYVHVISKDVPTEIFVPNIWCLLIPKWLLNLILLAPKHILICTILNNLTLMIDENLNGRRSLLKLMGSGLMERGCVTLLAEWRDGLRPIKPITATFSVGLWSLTHRYSFITYRNNINLLTKERRDNTLLSLINQCILPNVCLLFFTFALKQIAHRLM